MPKCHSCQRELDDAAHAAGRCSGCGAPVIKLAQRTIADIRSISDRGGVELDDTSQTVEIPPEGLVGGTTRKAGSELGTQATVTGPFTPSEDDTSTTVAFTAEKTIHFAAEDVAERPTPSKPEPPGQRTVAGAQGPTWQASGGSWSPPTRPTTSAADGDPNARTVDLGDAGSVPLGDASTSSMKTVVDPQPPMVDPKSATVALGGGRTVQIDEGAGGADATLVTSQWQSSLTENVKDSRATIKQKETVTGQAVLTSSSLIVKSRNVRGANAPAIPVTSAADAPDYELLNIIGEGGMGVVYAARQSSIARTVALKMLKGDDPRNAAHRDKFISEAVVTGELDHPNIVPIYDLGANNDGALFYSMKHVKGTPWNKVIREKSLEENLAILLRMADAVAFAHVNGVIHRDLKPENVMLGDFGEVLVMDWGLARVSPEFPNAASVSQSDSMGGTPAYMAPEMATGPLEKITAASDVYLIGAILFEIVAGHPPHGGKTVMACLFAAAKNQFLPTEAKGELMDIALRAMATAPEDRYQSVQAMQEAVRTYQSHSESIKLVDLASGHLKKAEEQKDYDLYARALYGMEESLSMWSGNRRAAELLAKSRLDYARLALDKGDYDLGASLLDPAVEDHRDLLAALEKGRRERESRQRRIKFLKRAVAALVAAVIGIVGVAYVAVSRQRDVAVREEARAKTAEGLATANAEKAVIARDDAVAQEKIAVAERQKAEEQKRLAEEQRGIAVEQRKAADEQRQLAVDARTAAEIAEDAERYGAYIARIGLTKAKIDENSFDRAAELLELCPPELRNWEWGRLNYLCRLSDETWRAAAPVDAAAFSPDGVHFATGDWAGAASIWNRKTGEVERKLPSQGQYVHAVAYDATGERLAAGSSDGVVTIYRAADGEALQQLVGHEDAVLSVRFSPDGKQLLTSGYDDTARVWDLAAGKQLHALEGHTWWVWSAEFAPDGESIVTASQDGKAIVWRRGRDDRASFVKAAEFVGHRGPVYAARFSPDGKLVATAGYDSRVLVWDPLEVQPVDVARVLDGLPAPPANYVELLGHRGPVRTLDFAADGKTLASGGQDNMAIVWDLAATKPLKELRGHASYVRSCDYSSDGQWLLTAGRDGQVKLWRPSQYGETRELSAGGSESADAILAARFSPDGTTIVTASRDRTASLWDAATQQRLQWLQEGHDFLASSAVFFADGTRLATGAGDGTVRLWDVATGAEIQLLKGTGRTSALDVSDDGRLIATGSPGDEVQIWDAGSGKLLHALPGRDAEVTALRFAPGGAMLAVGDEHGRCRLWSYFPGSSGWQAGHELRGHSRTITAIRFTKQGAELVTSSGDNTCGQWDVATGQEFTDRVLKHPNWVADVAVSHDGETALTCCEDGQLRLWSLTDAQLISSMQPQTDNKTFTSIDLSPDGQLAAAACAAEGSLRLWNLASGAEVTTRGPNGAPQAWLQLDRRAGQIWSARFAPDGQRLLAIGGNDARLLELDTKKMSVRFSPHGAVASADVSPDGSRVVTGSWDSSAKIWDAATGNVLAKLDNLHQGYINSACFSPDGKKVLTGGDDQTARLWDATTGKPLEPVFRGHTGRIRQASFSPDGLRVLTVSSDKTARIADAATGELLLTLAGHEWPVRSGAFSADGRFIITGSDDNAAIVWDAATGEQTARLAGHTGAITSVALSPHGDRALTGSEDNLVKLWDAATSNEILTLSGHDEEVTSVSFSPDGKAALTSGRDGRALIWPALDWSAAAQQAQR